MLCILFIHLSMTNIKRNENIPSLKDREGGKNKQNENPTPVSGLICTFNNYKSCA